MEESGEDSMICEGNARDEEEVEVSEKEVSGTFRFCQTKTKETTFKTFYVRVISCTAAT
jgi:uncharacterized membrane protein